MVAGPSREHQEKDPREYLRVLWRRKLAIAALTVLFAGTALGLSLLQTPVYSASTEILLQPRVGESLFDQSFLVRPDPGRTLRNEILVLESKPVVEAVEEILGSAPEVSVSAASQTDVITVTAEDEDPARAAEVANTYATAYIDVRRKQTVEDLLAAAEEIQATITDIDDQIRDLEAEIADAPAGQAEATRQRLAPQVQSLVQQQTLFKQKLRELQVDTSLKSGGAQVVSEAEIPSSPARPQPLRAGLLFGFFGLAVGTGLAFLLEFLDDSIKTKEDLERAVPGLATLGLIPAVEDWREGEEPRVVSLGEPSSPAAEAYRTLRTSVQFVSLDRPVKALQVTSPSSGEGKTTTLANLGVALARAGHKVALVCCDLRRPRIHEFFGLSNTVGFTSVLLGQAPLQAALQPVPGVERLDILASGPLPPNPSELLSSAPAAEVIAALKAAGYLVLIDSPPVLPVTDSLVLSKVVDAVLLVAVAGFTTRKQVARAVELLRQVGAPLAGTVLNGAGPDATYGYGYYYREENGGEGGRRQSGRDLNGSGARSRPRASS